MLFRGVEFSAPFLLKYDYSTAIIENRDVAEEKLKEVITSMKSWYKWYSEMK